MKWWHRWRWRVWQSRYYHAKGLIEMAKDHPDRYSYDEAVALGATAMSAAVYHWEKAGKPE